MEELNDPIVSAVFPVHCLIHPWLSVWRLWLEAGAVIVVSHAFMVMLSVNLRVSQTCELHIVVVCFEYVFVDFYYIAFSLEIFMIFS